MRESTPVCVELLLHRLTTQGKTHVQSDTEIGKEQRALNFSQLVGSFQLSIAFLWSRGKAPLLVGVDVDHSNQFHRGKVIADILLDPF